MKKKTANNFTKFAPKKSNAAIKEQFRQEKRKWKKEREEFFEKKRSQPRVGSQESGVGSQQPITNYQKPTTSNQQMPLNKFIAHAGICGRREAAELVKKGLVNVNGETVIEPGHKVSAKDEVKVNGKKIFPAKNLDLHFAQ